jgi:hypothetical protein
MNVVRENGRSIKIIKGIDQINEVMKEPIPKVIWGGIPEGSLGLITGVAKTGKTTFAENLAFSIAVGRKKCFDKPGPPRSPPWLRPAPAQW